MSAISRRHFRIVLLGTILAPLSLPGAGPAYPVTVKVLQALYRDEMLAYAAYLAYSGKAKNSTGA